MSTWIGEYRDALERKFAGLSIHWPVQLCGYVLLPAVLSLTVGGLNVEPDDAPGNAKVTTRQATTTRYRDAATLFSTFL